MGIWARTSLELGVLERERERMGEQYGLNKSSICSFSAEPLCLPKDQLVFRDVCGVSIGSRASHHMHICIVYVSPSFVSSLDLRYDHLHLCWQRCCCYHPPPQMTVSQPLLAARLRLANGSNRRHIASCIARLADATAGRYVQ